MDHMNVVLLASNFGARDHLVLDDRAFGTAHKDGSYIPLVSM